MLVRAGLRVSQDRSHPTTNSSEPTAPFAATHYGCLGLHPAASVRDIRQAYRELSKLYHPDTTALTAAVATEKFQALNAAYAILSSPEQRTAYDRKIGYSQIRVVRSLPSLNQPQPKSGQFTSSAYLDATDRPLSPGEMFALLILGVTFVGCLILAITIGFTKGEAAVGKAVLLPVSAISPVLAAPPLASAPPALPAERPIFLNSGKPVDKAPKIEEPASATAHPRSRR
jgi:DnaJ domain